MKESCINCLEKTKNKLKCMESGQLTPLCSKCESEVKYNKYRYEYIKQR